MIQPPQAPPSWLQSATGSIMVKRLILLLTVLPCVAYAATSSMTPFPFLAAEAPAYNNRVIGSMLRQTAALRPRPSERYAVFDWDDTAMIGDLSSATAYYQVKTLNFRIPPTEFFGLMALGYPDSGADACLEDGMYTSLGTDQSGKHMPFHTLLESLAADYNHLYQVFIGGTYAFEDPDPWYDQQQVHDPPMDLQIVQQEPAYVNFRAKLGFLLQSLKQLAAKAPPSPCAIDIATSLAGRLMYGMTEQEMQELARASIRWHLAARLEKQSFTAQDPDLMVTGTYLSGLRILNGQETLMRALRMHCIQVYVISESPQILVEEAANFVGLGYAVPKANVFGVRYEWDPNGKFTGQVRDDYPTTSGPGKREIIEHHLRPTHGDQAPLLASGDSVRDCEMFEAVEHGGIVHIVNRLGVSASGCIQTLMNKACTLLDKAERETGKRYLVQGLDWQLGTWIRSGWSTTDGLHYHGPCTAYKFLQI